MLGLVHVQLGVTEGAPGGGRHGDQARDAKQALAPATSSETPGS